MNPNPAEGKGSALLIVLFLVMFLASADNQLLIPLVPILASEFGVSIGQFGWVFSAYAFCAAAFNLIVGPLSDRYGRVLFLRSGLAAFSVTAVVTASATAFESFLLLRGVMGLIAGMLSTCTISYLGDRFVYSRRGRAIGFVLSSYFAALILGIPLSSWVAEVWEWPLVFRGSAVLALALAVAALFMLNSDRPESRADRSYLKHYRVLLSRRPVTASLLTSFVVSGATLAFLTYISGYLAVSFGMTPVRISMVLLVCGVGAAVASPISGWLADRWSKRTVFLTGNTLLAGPLLAIPFVGSGWVLFSCIFLVSLCVSFRQTSLQALQTGLVSFSERGTYIALRNSSSQLGIALAVLLAGLVYETQGYLGVVLLASALTLAGSAILYWSVPEPVDPQATAKAAESGSPR